MRGIVGGVFYFFGAMALLNTLLNACSSNENTGTGVAVSLVSAAVFIGIGHLINPLINPLGGGRGQRVDPAEYARIQRDRALDQARAERQAQAQSAQDQLSRMKRDIINAAEKRNRELGGGR